MWPFKRNRKPTQTTQVENEQYYPNERRENAGVAWLLAAVTLIITVLIVLGLFFAGRWIYRKVTHKDSGTSTTQTTDEGSKTSEQSPTATPESTNNGQSSTNTTNGSSSNTNSSSNSSQGTVTAPTQTNNPSSVSSNPTQTNNPNTITNTGPGDMIGIFVLVSLAGYFGYSEYLRRKATD